jgi:hypothetical protein
MVSLDSASARPIAEEVQLAISQRRSTEMRDKILSRQQRQEFWSKTIENEEASLSDRLRASELLGKSEIDFVEKRIEASVSLADIAARVGIDASETVGSIDKEGTAEPGAETKPLLSGDKQGSNSAQTGE